MHNTATSTAAAMPEGGIQQPTKQAPTKFIKVLAFFDLVTKLAATGALFGILVVLLRLDGRLSPDGKPLNVTATVAIREDAQPVAVTVSQRRIEGARPFAVALHSNNEMTQYYGGLGSSNNPFFMRASER